MDHGGSAGSSLNSTGDTSHLLQELMNLQKSNAMSTGTLAGSVQVHESIDAGGSGEATNPTLTELMKTFYDNPVPRQLITLQGSDTANSFSVFGREVDIVVSKTSSGHSAQPATGSNKVKITPVVKYDWDVIHYIGNLVAIHRNSVYAAYSLRGKSGGVVRVVNRRTAERTLLKDFVGRVVDIAFAHTEEIIIGAVDEMGNLAVYGIHESQEERLVTTLMMNILRTKDTPLTGYHRVIWCPFIPDDCDDSSATESSSQDASRVLVHTHDEKAEIWNVDLVTKEHSSSPILAENVEYGLIKIDSHTQPIMDAAFSPDGTALATASLDGEVKFFQVNMGESSSPRCLHQWKPHDGKQLSSLFFLDDHKFFTSDAQFWKFAVTGANNNQELKVWSCESWNCLQTVRFMSPSGLPSNFQVEPCMKAALDMSAKYLVLSDIKRQVLYVLQVHQDSESNTAHVSSVSEFLLAQPCLSFAIMDASKKKFKKSVEDDNHLDDITTAEETEDKQSHDETTWPQGSLTVAKRMEGELDKEDNEEAGEPKLEGVTTSGIQIKLYTVHPKTLQELQIRFRPESSVPPVPTPSVSTVSHDDTGIQDGLSDMSMSMDTSVAEGDSSKQDQLQPLLMTPEAFTTSPRKYKSDNSVMEPVRASGSSTSSFTHVTGLNEDFLSPRSSGDHSAVSVGSTNTQTPTSKEPSPGRTKDSDLTPSSVPLPPANNSEKQDLETPTKSKDSFELSDEATPTPLSGERLAKVCIDDLFDTQGSGRQTLERTNYDSTSSTTGFEVNDVIGAPKHSSSKYDENDEEVAEVLGETFNDDGEEKGNGEIEGTQPFDEQNTEGSTLSSEMEGKQVLRAWPRPPDVNTEGQKVTESTSESAYQEDDDVQVEEEEEICEEDEEMVNSEHATTGVRREDTQEASSEEQIEEHIEEQSEESEQDSPKEAPVAKTTEITDLKVHSPREIPVRVREIHKEVVREVVDKEALVQLQSNLQSVLMALESQNAQIQQIQYQLSEQREQQTELQRQQIEVEQLRQMAQQPQPNIDEHLGKLENIVTSRVERIFNQHSQREQQRVVEKENRDKHQYDRLQQNLTQTINVAVTNNMERQIRAEMKSTVLPGVVRVMEPVKDQIHHDLAQKLTATDSIMKDSIGKMVRSKQTVEAIGLAAGNALQTPIQAAYREAFQNIVIPNFERASQMMFQQINESFAKGSKEYTRNLESHLEQLKQQHIEARDPIVAQLRKLTDSFQASADTMQTQILATLQSQVASEMQAAMTNLQDSVVQSLRQAVKEEVSIAIREQGASISDSVLNAMRSGTVTPVHVTPDPHQAQTHILQLLRQGQLNSAFQEALSASNLELVMFVCETVNPSQVFNQSPCPLQQPVLLSLIQQLSADLGNRTDLKNKYLEEAVMNLDTSNSVTREHIKTVLYVLINKLKTYIASHPNAKSTRSLKMLQMASESLLM